MCRVFGEDRSRAPVMPRLAVLIVVVMGFLFVGACRAEEGIVDDDVLHLELEIFRRQAPILQERIRELEEYVHQMHICAGNEARADPACIYREKWFAFQGEALGYNLQVFRWQLIAATGILALVTLLIISGICFAGYQLWTSAKLSMIAGDSTEIAISTKQVRLQTSVVGVVLIALAGLMLLAFLHFVFEIREVDLTGAQGGGR